jgi:DNA-binding SARP family transcriptional activator
VQDISARPHPARRLHTEARRNLSQALYNIRQVIYPVSTTVLAVTAKTIQLTPGDQLQVDVHHLEHCLQLPRQHTHAQAILCDDCRRQLETAVSLHRGEFLAGFYTSGTPVFEEWLLLKRNHYRENFAGLLRSLARHGEMLGNYSAALQYLQQILELDPLDEAVCRQRMRLLALSGQRNAALRQYEQYRQLLYDELGAEPEETTQALHQQLLAVEAQEDDPVLLKQPAGVLPGGDEPWSEAHTLEVAGEMARARGEYEQASHYHERALALNRQRNDPRSVARSLSFLGPTARDTGQLERASRLVQQARQIYLELGDRFSGAEMDTTLARLLSVTGEFSGSAALLRAALPAYDALGLLQRVAYFNGGLAFVQMMLGQFAEARAIAGQCIQLSYLEGDQLGICFGVSLLAVIAIADENGGDAGQLLNRGLVLARQVGRPEELGALLSSLGYLMLTKGDFERARLHLYDGLQTVANSHNIVAALFVVAAAALFLKLRGQGRRARELYLLCWQFPMFRKAAYFPTLYAPYFGQQESPASGEHESTAPVDLLWRAVDDLIAHTFLITR